MLQYKKTDSDINIFKNKKLAGEISNNRPNDLSGANVYKALEFYW